ncbi:hypothetical protein [Halomicrobium salinisoli]|uniref:hypothetical protein n=1 Tax=Halomicrobium salinisoli TaxID=2878391 RepID=UPI001CF0C0A9|nr:hypothetical protein [Halomicrobium salinisoli]
MTVSAPDFDPELSGHSAIEVEGICHAVVSEYPADGDPQKVTECGDHVVNDPFEKDAREAFIGEAEMCSDCWPESVFSESP